MLQKVREVAKGKKYAIGFDNGRVCVTDMPMTALENRYRQGLNTSVENEIFICMKLLAPAAPPSPPPVPRKKMLDIVEDSCLFIGRNLQKLI